MQVLRDNFTLAATSDWGSRPTVTKWLHMKLRIVYYALLAAPFLGIIVAWGSWRRNPVAILLLLLCTAGLLVPVCVFSIPALRYLHSFGFIVPVFLAVVVNQLGEAWRCRLPSWPHEGAGGRCS